MRATLTALFLALAPLCAPMPAAADADMLGAAIDAVRAADWDRATDLRNGLDDATAQAVVDWHLLRAGRGDLAAYERFLAEYPGWPGLPYLRQRGEAGLGTDLSADRVFAYFDGAAPRTGAGVLALAAALQDSEQPQAAEAEVLRGWTEMVLTGDEAAALRAAHGDLLNADDHHTRRLDHLLWEGAEARARAMLPLVPEEWRTLAAARIGLRDRVPGVDALIEAVPASLSDDPGLAYERFLWRVRAGFWDTAGVLMAERSISAAALGRPAAWADRRADLARDVMREGDFDTCYTYAADHFVDPGVDYIAVAELEWLAGYCAYRQGQFDIAVGHFETFRDTVFSPISMGRAGYWLGRAHRGAGQADAAAAAFALGARYQSSFYGQLAAEAGGLPTDPAFLADEDYGPWRNASFTGSSVFLAALLLYEADEHALAERFLTHLTESLSRTEAGRLADFALDLGDVHLALRIAKRAAQNGHEIMRAYYPLADFAQADLPVDPALALSIARRESEFDPGVASGAGALGLMQVMPGTGRDTAAALGIRYEERRLIGDPAYNLLLGAAYLADLMDRFDGNLVLVSVGYNAGPGRAAQWIDRFGDPRQAEDIVFWIEAIPFSETRNYIMRVTESIPIYEAQLTGELPEPRLAARLVE